MRKLSFFIQTSALFLTFLIQAHPMLSQEFGRDPLIECWRLNNENLSTFEIASDNVNTLYLSLTDGSVQAIEKKFGKSLWKSEIGGEIITPIISDGKQIFFVSKVSRNIDGNPASAFIIRALSSTTGITTWQKTLEVENLDKIYLSNNSNRLYTFADSGFIHVLNKENGEVLSKNKFNFQITSIPFQFGDKIYVGNSNNKIVILDNKSLQITKEIDSKNSPTAILVKSTDDLYAGDSNGNVQRINIENEKVEWKAWTGAEITSISKISNGILVSSFDNYVYLLSEKTGKRIWKKRLSGRSIGRPHIKDDVAVFSTLAGTDAVFIELKKGKSVNQLKIQDENFFTNNPAGVDDLLVFPTYKGVFAFGSMKACQSIE